jgi:hypothetical protein
MTVRRIERYPDNVSERLDPERPAYSSAVKSIAAFCDKNNMTKACFQVLVSHLDNACAESACAPKPGRLQKLVRLK